MCIYIYHSNQSRNLDLLPAPCPAPSHPSCLLPQLAFISRIHAMHTAMMTIMMQCFISTHSMQCWNHAAMRPKGQHCLTRFLPKVLHLLEGQPDLLSRRCNSSHRLRLKSVNCPKVLPFNLARRPLRLVTCASGPGGTDASGVELSPTRRSDAKTINVR